MFIAMIENVYGKTWTKDFYSKQAAEQYVENLAWSEELKSSSIVEA